MDSASYFERRAEAELALAEQAVHPAAVRAHYLLAGFYLDHIYGGTDEQPQPNIAETAPKQRAARAGRSASSNRLR